MTGIFNTNINGYHFTVEFVSGEENEDIIDFDGRTYPNKRLILINSKLDTVAAEIVLRHEVVHAVLDTQGRCFQDKFNLEDMCEFVAYNLPMIDFIVKSVMKDAKRANFIDQASEIIED